MRPTVLALALTCALGAPLALAQTATTGPTPDAPQVDCTAPQDDAERAACTAAEAAGDAAASAMQALAPDPAADAQAPADAAMQDAIATPVPAIACEALADRAERARCEAPASTPAARADAGAAAGSAEAMPSASGATDAPTQAEQDFNALYGAVEPYDPVADPTLPPEATSPKSYDPWERWNRRSHRINDAIDRRVAKPLARAYMAAVPRPVRLGVSNFFSNLGQPVSALNALLQGKPKQAGQSAGRFLLNSTLGIGGIFDPATDARLPNGSEDFGQTLGVWGWKTSRYVELPVFGPRTVRDVVGLAGDSPLSPMRQVQADAIRIPLQGLQLVDLRTRLMSTDALREGVEDDYALVRDAWLQRRNYQIFGDRMDAGGDDAGLPDYLREDPTPVIPVDAMPVIPNG